MSDALIETLRRHGTIRHGGRYVILLSGGRDSTCLAHACVTIAGAQATSAVHVNYGLRPSADSDQAHCEALCAGLGIGCRVAHRRPPEGAGNRQAWAREVRYAVAREQAGERGAQLAVGHTRDDQLETILYRLISSPSRRAVLGMRERDGDLLRPLLTLTRAETTAYCERHGLPWCDDETNATGAYVRNRIRHELVPLLADLHPGAERNLLALAERLREENAVLDELVEQALGGGDTIALPQLRSLPPALARLVLQRLADGAAAGIAPGAGKYAPAVIALREQGSASLDIGSGLQAVVEYGVVRVQASTSGSPAVADAPLPIPGTAPFAGGVVRCDLTQPERHGSVLDRATLGDALTVRAWRAGDRMRPLGLHGSKSLQDLFTARHVPRAQRGRVAVVCTGEEIVWVAGVAIAERCKVRPETRDAVRLTVTAHVTAPAPR